MTPVLSMNQTHDYWIEFIGASNNFTLLCEKEKENEIETNNRYNYNKESMTYYS